MTARSTTHATFAIERAYEASPASVFGAWADPEAKRAWFGPGEGREARHSLEFAVGGRERLEVTAGDGALYTYDACYRDIVPAVRILYAYDMYREDTRISVSLATVELEAVGYDTRLTFTEQGAFLDGHDNAAEREHGTRGLLAALASFLEREPPRG